MIILLFGEEPYFIQNKLNEIINKNADCTVVKLNGNDKDFDINQMLESLNTNGLFSEKTLVLVKDPPFLINKLDDKQNKLILDYCNEPSYENELILYSFENRFNTRLKLFKDIQANAQTIILNKLERNDFFSFAKNTIIESKILLDKEASNTLINSVNYDIDLLMRNLEILKLYPGKIDIDVLRSLISMPNDEDVFRFINALTNKNVSLAIQSATSLLENDESLLKLLSVVASQLRFLYQVAYYNKQGNSLSEIIKLTGAKEFRIKKANECLNNLDMYEILRLLNRLSELDYRCKLNNSLSEKLNLELFIVSMLEKE